MHSAPAVSYPVGRSRFQLRFIVCLLALGFVAGLLWCTAWVGWRQCLYAVTWLAAGMIAVQAWRASPRGRLIWNGQDWRWTSIGASVWGRVTVHLDLQFVLVLSLRTPTGRRIWLWPERGTNSARWQALRQAVFSRQTPEITTEAPWAPPVKS